tara:strand:- start:252 stop:473 length:222 start_codon:yes stop_codon:yes gene_type:complete
MEKDIDELKYKVNEILLILDDLSKVNTTQEHIELHETEKKETNSKSDGDSGKQSDNGNKKKSNRNNKNSKSSE